MKKANYVVVVVLALSLTGCSGQMLGGAVGGSVGAGAAYEYNAKRQLDKIKEDLDNGTIDQEEYDIRKDQIERFDSVLLTDTVNTSDPLLDSHRIPRQVVVHDDVGELQV